MSPYELMHARADGSSSEGMRSEDIRLENSRSKDSCCKGTGTCAEDSSPDGIS